MNKAIPFHSASAFHPRLLLSVKSVRKRTPRFDFALRRICNRLWSAHASILRL